MYDIATAAGALDVDPHRELLEDPPPTYQEHMEMASREVTATRSPESDQPEPRVYVGETGSARESDRVRTNITLEGRGVGAREYEVLNTRVQPRPPMQDGDVGPRISVQH